MADDDTIAEIAESERHRQAAYLYSIIQSAEENEGDEETVATRIYDAGIIYAAACLINNWAGSDDPRQDVPEYAAEIDARNKGIGEDWIGADVDVDRLTRDQLSPVHRAIVDVTDECLHRVHGVISGAHGLGLLLELLEREHLVIQPARRHLPPLPASAYPADAVPLDPPPGSRLVEQLRQQLADEAIEYLDHPDGHDDLPGIYASMCHIRRAIAAAEGNVGGHGEQGDDHG